MIVTTLSDEDLRLLTGAKQTMTNQGTVFEGPLALAGVLRNSVLAWIGAVAVVQEEFETWARQLIERGELAEAEGRQFVQEMIRQHRSKSPNSGTAASAMGAVKNDCPPIREKMMDWCLSRMGRPTKQETRDLSARIEALEARIEELCAR
jgi:poly(hydroxyalkanoate) granule-associated protein